MKNNKNKWAIIFYSTFIGISAVVIIAVFSIIILPSSGGDNVSDNVIATVNGIPIYKKDIDAGLPKDAFGPSLKYMRKSRLDNLIYIAVLKHFLEQEKIRIEAQRVDRQIEYLKKYPPSSGCSCCRYGSLEQFMQLNNYTMPELRDEIRVNMGLETYMDRLWQQKYLTKEKRLGLVKENRQDIEVKYINVSHIFFNVFQDPWFQKKPDTVIKRKMNGALAVLKRLENGENFENVAKEVSEDTVSRENGGALGCISKNIFGLEFSRAATKLSPGQYSQPVQSVWGVHIIKRNEITDKDIINILKKQFRDEKQVKTIKKLMDEAKIVRYDKEMQFDK